MVQEDGPFQANPNQLLRGEDSDDEVQVTRLVQV